jgi:hypothetical protein
MLDFSSELRLCNPYGENISAMPREDLEGIAIEQFEVAQTMVDFLVGVAKGEITKCQVSAFLRNNKFLFALPN